MNSIKYLSKRELYNELRHWMKLSSILLIDFAGSNLDKRQHAKTKEELDHHYDRLKFMIELFEKHTALSEDYGFTDLFNNMRDRIAKLKKELEDYTQRSQQNGEMK